MTIEYAIMQVESGGDLNVVGDKTIEDHAYGCMQIRRSVCIDVNKIFGTSFEPEDMLGWKSKSLAVFWLYMAIYATSEALGRPVTDEDRARIWNGGPSAWNPSTPMFKATTSYWTQVRRLI